MLRQVVTTAVITLAFPRELGSYRLVERLGAGGMGGV